MKIIEPGKKYMIVDSAGKEVEITFFHKGEDGQYVSGFMAEEIISVLVHRQEHFVHVQRRANEVNLNILTFLKQAYALMRQRNYAKMLKRTS